MKTCVANATSCVAHSPAVLDIVLVDKNIIFGGQHIGYIMAANNLDNIEEDARYLHVLSHCT